MGIRRVRSFILGGWPHQEFRALSDDDKVEFYRKEVSDAKALESLVLETLAKRRIESRAAEFSGEYLPLEVYAKRGFDVNKIVANC